MSAWLEYSWLEQFIKLSELRKANNFVFLCRNYNIRHTCVFIKLFIKGKLYIMLRSGWCPNIDTVKLRSTASTHIESTKRTSFTNRDSFLIIFLYFLSNSVVKSVFKSRSSSKRRFLASIPLNSHNLLWQQIIILSIGYSTVQLTIQPQKVQTAVDKSLSVS